MPVLAQVKLEASVSPAVITADEEAVITVKVSGGQSTSDPVAPRVAGLSIILTGRSSQINIFNSQVQSSSDYEYTVVPSDPGEYNIGAFTVYSSGVEYRSNPLKLSVKAGGSYSSTPSSPFNSSPNPNYRYPQQQQDEAPAGENFWISTSVSQTNPKLHEEMIFSFKLFTRVGLEFEDLKLPAFKDFRKEELVPEKKGKQTINGKTFSTYEIIYALYPLKPGALTIEETSAKVKYYVQDRQNYNSFFFNFSGKPRHKTLSAKAIPIQVEDLPQPRPDDFTDLVGRFTLEASLSDHELNVGDSATLTLTLRGQGNIRDARLPDFKLSGYKIYEDKPVEQIDKTKNGVRGSKTFTLALMPTEPGDLKLGDFSLSYYDVESQSYSKLKLPEMMLVAKGSPMDQGSQAVLAQAGGEKTVVTLKDLAPLVPSAKEAFRGPPLPVVPEMVAQMVFWGLPLAFVLWILGSALWIAYVRPTRRSQSRKAWRGLARVLKSSASSDRELWEALKEFFAAQMDLGKGAATSSEMRRYCQSRLGDKWPEKAQEIGGLLEKVEGSQYGFAGEGLKSAEKETLKKLLKDLL